MLSAALGSAGGGVLVPAIRGNHMRSAGNAAAAGFRRRRVVVAIGLSGTLFLAGCASQVGGTALAPTSVLQISTSSSAVSTTDTPTSSSTDDSSTSDTSSSQSSTSDTSSSETSTRDTSSSDRAETSSPATSAPSSTDDSAPSGSTIRPAAFAAKMKAANAGVKSLKGSISVDAGPASVTGSFGETLADGQVNALDMSMFIAQGTEKVALRLLIVNSKIYLGGTTVLKSLNVGSKKWALAGTNSKNATLRNLADQLSGYLTTASANQYELYAAAAKKIVDGGEAKIGTVAAHRYDITVDVTALAKASSASVKASAEVLAKAGITTLPTTLWLDSSNRLVQSSSTVTVSGITSKTLFKVNAYNVPVTIRAPAAADVFTG